MIEIGLDGIRYSFRTLEGAYQSFKCPERMYEFTNLSTKEAMELGRTVELRSDWNEVKDYVRSYLLYIKYEKGEDKEALLSTPKNKIKDSVLLAIREKCKTGYTIDHNANFLCKEYCEKREIARINQQADAIKPLSLDKTLHCASVARVCMESANKYGLNEAQMYAVGLLHDIGYVYGRGNHETHGAELLETMGLSDEYIFAVRLHGKNPNEITFDKVPEESLKCLVALYEADMSVDAKGHIIGFEKRLEDIELRYGKDHIAAKTAASEIEFVKKYQAEHDIAPASMNKKKEASLFGITEGIVCQQCNCIGAYGAGISGAISRQFPEVESDFRKQFSKNKGNQFGTHRLIKLSDTLYVANIYSQDEIKMQAEDVPTNMETLVNNIIEINNNSDGLPVYLPHSKNIEHDGIGCGLGGGKWSDLVVGLQNKFAEDDIVNVFALNTMTGVVGENIKDIDITKIEDYKKEEVKEISAKDKQTKKSVAFDFGK